MDQSISSKKPVHMSIRVCACVRMFVSTCVCICIRTCVCTCVPVPHSQTADWPFLFLFIVAEKGLVTLRKYHRFLCCRIHEFLIGDEKPVFNTYVSSTVNYVLVWITCLCITNAAHLTLQF